MLVTSANVAMVTQSYRAAFNSALTPAASDWSKIATQMPSQGAANVYGWLSAFPEWREWVGDRRIRSLSASEYTVKNLDWESTVSVDSNLIEDDMYGTLTPQMAELGASWARHLDKQVFGLLSAGDTTVGPDNQYFFDTDHKAGGTSVSNFGGGAGAPWFLLDTSRAVKPLIYQERRGPRFQLKDGPTEDRVFWKKEVIYGADARGAVAFGFWQQAYMSRQPLTQTAFDDAMASFLGTRSDDGNPLGVFPTMLVVGPSNRAAASLIVNAAVLANGATNLNYKVVDLLVSPYIVG